MTPSSLAHKILIRSRFSLNRRGEFRCRAFVPEIMRMTLVMNTREYFFTQGAKERNKYGFEI